MEYTSHEDGKGGQDRVAVLKQRIIQLKRETEDVQFHAYLDRTWNEVQYAEKVIGQLETGIEQNYALYQRTQAAQQQMAQQAQNVQPQAQQAFAQQQQQYAPYQAAPMPVRTGRPQKSMEFQFGTVILGVVGIAFLLVAFITFGINYMNNVMQGMFLYLIGIIILLSSELFFAKRVEKFSYCLTGLGISSLYITTILNYLYLEVLPGWAALLITVAVTGFFFYLSRKKDSGMIRIICLIGCYLSLIPLHQLQSILDFALPAIVIFIVNLAGVYCPVKKRRKAVDAVQYICCFSLIFYLIYLQFLSGLETWPAFILVGTVILTLSLLYLHSQDGMGTVLYFIGQTVNLGYLLYIGHHEYWLPFGIIGMLVLYAALTAVFWKTKLRFASYLFLSGYVILAYMAEGDAFWLTFACLLVFIINKSCVRFFREFPVPDAVYTMVSAIGVCCLARSSDVQVLGYVYAFAILLSCIFVKKYQKYHIYLSLSFGWLFLLTEDCRPFLSSIMICILAAATIGAGFYKKDKGVRIYGLVLMIFVALKLVVYDFYESQAGIRILVFLVVGLLILAVSFLYIYFEKKLNEEEKRQQEAQMPMMEQGMQPTELNLSR